MIFTMTDSKLRKGRTSGSLVVEELREDVRSFVSTDLLRYRTRPSLESGWLEIACSVRRPVPVVPQRPSVVVEELR